MLGSMRAPDRLATDAVEEALEIVRRADPLVRAWAYLDPERARREAATADVRGIGNLSGIVVGVKDIFDTSDQPSQYGSPIYDGYRPVADAAAVALLREGGAVCLGKTVTSELAYMHPGPTTNPHRPTHTPGGSSMGSAASVAAGMVDVALGTQTGDSIILPASFCGVYGFKPTFGTVSIAGVKTLAPSLDTVGWFSRDPHLLDDVRTQLTGRPEAGALRGSPTIGLLRTDQWEECSQDCKRALVAGADIAQALGANVVDIKMPEPFVGLGDRHKALMAYEAARSLAWEHRVRRDKISTELREMLDYGRTVAPAQIDAVRAQKAAALTACAELFGRCSALLTPAVEGEAPRDLRSTGSSPFGSPWTLLGLPALSIPAGAGLTGMPVGVQLVGAVGSDAQLLSIGTWLTGGKAVPPTGAGPFQGLLA
jgi:amidase